MVDLLDRLMYVWLNGWMVDLLDGLSMYGLIDVWMVDLLESLMYVWMVECMDG